MHLPPAHQTHTDPASTSSCMQLVARRFLARYTKPVLVSSRAAAKLRCDVQLIASDTCMPWDGMHSVAAASPLCLTANPRLPSSPPTSTAAVPCCGALHGPQWMRASSGPPALGRRGRRMDGCWRLPPRLVTD